MGSQNCSMVITFTLLQLLLQMSAVTSYSGEIISAPETQITTRDSTVQFNCHAIGDSYWRIDGTQVNFITLSTFEERGFQFQEVQLSTNPLEYNMTITALASLENNNTAIQCMSRGSVINQVAASAIVRLIIASPPLPAPLSLNLLNATSTQLSWSTPFTHDGFEVEHYTVTMQSTANAGVLEWQLETSPLEFNREGGIAQNCEELTFTLTSTNAIGVSSATTVSGGFPTVPGPLPSLINTEVSFLQDGTLQVEIDFQLPGLCDFQTSEYTIMIEKEVGEGPIILGPTAYTSSDSLSVETEVDSGLGIGHTYTVSVFVESLAGKSNTSTATFSTIINYPSLDAELTSTIINYPSLDADLTTSTAIAETTPAPDSDSSEHSEVLEIGIGVGIGVGVLLACVLLGAVGILVGVTIRIVHLRHLQAKDKEINTEMKKVPPLEN